MEKAKIVEELIKEQGYNKRRFAAKCGIPESTLYSILKRGVGGASVNIVMNICKELGITVEELDDMATGEKQKHEPSYDDIELLVARNGKKMSKEQKLRLIQLLSEIDE